MGGGWTVGGGKRQPRREAQGKRAGFWILVVHRALWLIARHANESPNEASSSVQARFSGPPLVRLSCRRRCQSLLMRSSSPASARCSAIPPLSAAVVVSSGC